MPISKGTLFHMLDSRENQIMISCSITKMGLPPKILEAHVALYVALVPNRREDLRGTTDRTLSAVEKLTSNSLDGQTC